MGERHSDDRLFLSWLERTRQLQISSFNVDPASLEGQDLGAYIMWNALAAHDEISEALQEVVWKPWVKSGHGDMNRAEFVGELVDVLHFVANMLVAARCTDDELEDAYSGKMQRNRDRQQAGYSGIKCPECGREIESMSKIVTMGRETFVCACGVNLS